MLEELLKMRADLDRIIAQLEEFRTTKRYTRSNDELMHGLIVAVTYKILEPEKYRCVVFGEDFIINN